MWLAYRGYSIILLAPVLALLAVGLEGGHSLLGAYTQVFMPALGKFIATYFPVFILGSLFGTLMDGSGSAHVLARAIYKICGRKRAIAAIVLACGVLTYAGVSAFVAVFSIFPLAARVFREANIPKRLIPGAISSGALSFTMTALPGTAQIHNLIPIPYFGTDAYAAPVLGLITGALLFGLAQLWLDREARIAAENGEGYGDETLDLNTEAGGKEVSGSLARSVLPIAVVIAGNYVLTLAKVDGMDSMILSLLAACVATLLLNLRRLKGQLQERFQQGVLDSVLPIFATASEVGYGAAIAGLVAFGTIKEWIFSLAPSQPLVAEAVSVNILAGITGSASGGLGIALETLGKSYLEAGTAAGISPEVLHRIGVLAAGGLDSLPHNGAVITLLAVCGCTHRSSYKDIFVVSVVVPLIVTVLAVAMASWWGAF
jgi:H+/gluconate symporter-like permease